MSKVIFYDVDGTLFRHDIRVPASAARAIEQCAAKGQKRAGLCLPLRIEKKEQL